jgi:2-polyprenyl-3-methyl-5-hydroxy-6-metoxy-1,4-benzoquinol methylase
MNSRNNVFEKYSTSKISVMKIAYSCVVDAKPHFEWQAFVLVHSLLKNLHCEPRAIKVHCLPGVSQAFRRVMRRLGADVIDIEPFDGHPYCNKIQQCFSSAYDDYNKIMLLDCDLYFTAMPIFEVGAVFSAKIVDLPNPPLVVLEAVYRKAGITQPELSLVGCPTSDEEYTFVNNFNGGLYIIDQKLIDRLGAVWKEHAHWLLEHIDMLGEYGHHVDQIAMSLALSQLEVRTQPLSVLDNFPVHLEAERIRPLAQEGINVIHYHKSLLPDGRIKPTGISEVDCQIARVNLEIQAALRQEFDNEVFWSMRYELFQELGSGVGSRGETLALKHNLLACALEGFFDKQIVDVGCGDLELSGIFDFRAYTGYDLSAEALKIAQRRRPEWKFVYGSIYDQPEKRASLVMCLDVLIHQKTREDYLKLITALVNATEQRLILSGYEEPPVREFTSDICAYHEPISQSLRELDVFNEVLIIGRYRGLALIVADKQTTGPDFHENDLPVDDFRQIIDHVERKDLLRLIMDTSRNRLGFYTKTAIRTIEYPWTLAKIMEAGPKTVADIGAGISPLPIVLDERGYAVTTIDFHPMHRDVARKAEWNEWGFLDYSQFNRDIASYNVDVLNFRPKDKFDLIYSVSVIEHMPRHIWEQFIQWSAAWLKPGSRLILTLDLIPDTEQLWNFSEGTEVEPTSQHGSLTDFRAALKKNGLIERECSFVRHVPLSRTDVVLLDCVLEISKPNLLQSWLDKAYAMFRANRH